MFRIFLINVVALIKKINFMVSSTEIVAHTQTNGIMVSRRPTITMTRYVQKHLINDETKIKVLQTCQTNGTEMTNLKNCKFI